MRKAVTLSNLISVFFLGGGEEKHERVDQILTLFFSFFGLKWIKW
jgi:hypothetical protein